MNLFFLLTYPEFLIVAKAFEGLSALLALRRGVRRHWVPLVGCNAAVIAMHPLLIVARARAMATHVGQDAYGWNVIGDPVTDTSLFVGNLAGVRYGDLAFDPLAGVGSVALWPFILLVIIVAGIGLVTLARRFQVGWPVSAWLVVLVVGHAASVQRIG